MTLCYAQGEDGVARNQWPGSIAMLRADQEPAIEKQLVLPRDWELLEECLMIQQRQGMAHDRQHGMGVFTHASAGEEEALLRLWGYVKEVNNSATGNWNFQRETAHRAAQFIVLESKGCDAAFGPQQAALANISQYVTAVLNGGPQVGRGDTLYVRHRVFRKARGSERQQYAQYVHGEDPTGRAAKISKEWRLTSVPPYVRRHVDGELVRTSALSVRPGDFVEVLVRADVLYHERGGQEKNHVRVDWELAQVIRLFSAEQLESLQRSMAVDEHSGEGNESANEASGGND
ncbi:hypothetical protein NM688_g8656 [Phlebia brevispora]|uniref:Uncharacterized protein n=1 Tax=Phlebia brevispora TaxID=194682 RepID=A0ACC1RPL3_9APHY|nr:hypothetical protein NM688_g8656 [Phlebia brevispora]